MGRRVVALLASASALAGTCLLLAPLAGAAQPGGPAATGAGAGAVAATLSNLKTLSRWAYAQAEAPVHAQPSALSPVIGRLGFLTPEGQAAVYLALRSLKDGAAAWVLVPLPGPSNRARGWVEAGALGELHLTREYLRVDREALKATLYRDGHAIWRAPVGVGRSSLPTPAGHFYVTEKLMGMGIPLYGPYALGTSAYSPRLREWPGGGVVGIHGTDEPQLLPGRVSHGCIRLRNPDILRLARLMPVGTPVTVR